LSTLSNRPVIDDVAADGVHLASPAAGTERDDGPEGVVELLPFAGGDVLGDLPGVFRIARIGEPDLDVCGCGGSYFFRSRCEVELQQGGGGVKAEGHGRTFQSREARRESPILRPAQAKRQGTAHGVNYVVATASCRTAAGT